MKANAYRAGGASVEPWECGATGAMGPLRRTGRIGPIRPIAVSAYPRKRFVPSTLCPIPVCAEFVLIHLSYPSGAQSTRSRGGSPFGHQAIPWKARALFPTVDANRLSSHLPVPASPGKVEATAAGTRVRDNQRKI